MLPSQCLASLFEGIWAAGVYCALGFVSLASLSLASVQLNSFEKMQVGPSLSC